MFGLKESTEKTLRDIGLLWLRVGAGVYMMSHGAGKLQKVLNGDFKFGNPIGLGPEVSLITAAGAEFVCAGMVVLGFLTRVFSAPVAFTMLVAAFVVHNQPGAEVPQYPFKNGEMALLYAIMFIALVFLGGGKYSLDTVLAGVRARKKQSAKR